MNQITLRRASEADIDFIVTAEVAPDNTPFIGRWPRSQHIANLGNGTFSYLIIERQKPDSPLGYVILEGLKDENRSLNIKRIVVVEKGLGIGRAAIQQIKNLAFSKFQAHRLWLDVKTFNDRAKHIYETEGFKIEGTLRDCIKNGDQYESLTVLSILESEFTSQKINLQVRG
ncbi:MAG: GNAT family protein [Proteobacteria bacterium]|nr:GNAT family protein [Pseudomonadota bacterium]